MSDIDGQVALEIPKSTQDADIQNPNIAPKSRAKKRFKEFYEARKNPHDPISVVKKHKEPRTKKEFVEWMKKTQQKLQLWLEEATKRARDEEVARKLDEFTRKSKSSWDKYEALCDIQTGEIYDPGEHKALQTLVETERDERKAIHQQHHVHPKQKDFMFAQSAWEDFLFYQNVWNRRFGWNPRGTAKFKGTCYTETEAEKREVKEMEKRAKELGKFPCEPAKEPPHDPPGDGDANTADPGFDTDEVHGDDQLYVDELQQYFDDWTQHIISVFRKFKVGYRQCMPDSVGPQETRRYTQSIRNNTRMTTQDYLKRKAHLQDRFPGQRGVDYIPGNIEEIHTNPCARIILKYTRPDQLVRNDAQPDTEGFQAVRESYEREQPKSSIASLRENGHVLHHGFTERSRDWPTSYESPDWGNEFAIVGVKHTPVFQEEENQEENSAPAFTSTQVRYKLNQNKNPIPKLETRKRYKLKSTSKPGQVFQHQMNDDGTVAGRHREKGWPGTVVDGIVTVESFELDEKNQRILLDSSPVTRIEYSTAIVTWGSPALTRRERIEQKGLENEHSEDEDANFVPLDPNWARSGNMNPNASEAEGGSGDGAEPNRDGDEAEDVPSGDSDSDSDHDRFRQSYRMAVSTRMAVTLQQSMGQSATQYPHLPLPSIVEALRRGLSEELLRAEWQAQLDIRNGE